MLIHDKKHFWAFVNTVLPKLAPGEVYFVSLSARKKYLNAQDSLNLGRTEMFGRTLCYGDWEYTMAKLEANLKYKTTKDGYPYPENSLVIYVNINPSSSIKASGNFAKKVLEIQNELLRGYINSNTPNLDVLNHADRLLLNEFQKATGTRHYLDIDVDISKEASCALQDHLNDAGIKYHKITSRGGWHFLVDRYSRNETKFPLHKIIQPLNSLAKKQGGEVIINSNAMVPMPGTIQGGILVTLESVDE